MNNKGNSNKGNSKGAIKSQLNSLGFQGKGIVPNSFASKTQADIGNVAHKSAFAECQKTGATSKSGNNKTTSNNQNKTSNTNNKK